MGRCLLIDISVICDHIIANIILKMPNFPQLCDHKCCALAGNPVKLAPCRLHPLSAHKKRPTATLGRGRLGQNFKESILRHGRALGTRWFRKRIDGGSNTRWIECGDQNLANERGTFLSLFDGKEHEACSPFSSDEFVVRGIKPIANGVSTNEVKPIHESPNCDLGQRMLSFSTQSPIRGIDKQGSVVKMIRV
jgi:hypothetical protein